MYILGLQGSPRKNGNTDHLLSLFLNESEDAGATVEKIFVSGLKLSPCRGCLHCEEKGACIFSDSAMTEDIYPKIRQADLIVMATPVYFYAMTAQLKLLLDRCQMFWSRKYRFKLNDPGYKNKKGLLLSVAASSGKSLFTGIELCADYFFDAVGAVYTGSMVYRGVEKKGDMAGHHHVLIDVKKKVDSLVRPFLKRKRILFIDKNNGARSRIAEAFTKLYFGDKIDAQGCGMTVQSSQNKLVESIMAEKKMDMAYYKSVDFESAVSKISPDVIISMGKDTLIPSNDKAGIPHVQWDLPEPSGMKEDELRQLRDKIESEVLSLK